MIGRKKQQPNVIDLSNESVAKILDSLHYTKGVRQGVAFQSAELGEVGFKSRLLQLLLINKRLSFGDYYYKFDSKTIERTNPDKIKPDKPKKWTILKRN